MFLKNTLTGKLEEFTPIDRNNVKMYVCGPTIYNTPHIGNARSLIIFDVLFRLLRHHFPKVTYVRNITDVDDKIINKAKELKISTQELTKKVLQEFNYDIEALGLLQPTFEPKATEHINDMIEVISDLIKNGYAYVIEGHVLFRISKDFYYGCLSNRKKDDMIPGKRISIASYKEDPLDFVLWKPADGQVGWDSPWGFGRPGWHIECSAMSNKLLGDHFDIHGGGQDLIFPHHENEIAQSRYYHNHGLNANYWVHNGMLTVNGKKMSKSQGNAVYIKDLLKEYNGDVIKYFFLMTHYSKQANLTDISLDNAKHQIMSIYNTIEDILNIDNILKSSDNPKAKELISNKNVIDEEFLKALDHDMNTPLALFRLQEIVREVNNTHDPKEKLGKKYILLQSAKLLGFFSSDISSVKNSTNTTSLNTISDDEVNELIQKRCIAKKEKNFALADQIRNELLAQNIQIEDISQTESKWKRI